MTGTYEIIYADPPVALLRKESAGGGRKPLPHHEH